MKQCRYKTEEFWCGLQGQRIFGILYRPESVSRPPLVIFSHEMGKTYTSGIGYAEALAREGMAVYLYDIRGGSIHCRSDGTMQEMSAFTVADDLKTIIDDLVHTDLFDPGRIVLLGASLGGFASSVTAMRYPEEIAGMILLYPGFVLIEDIQREYDTKDQIPEEFLFNKWFRVGRCFATDVWDFDPYTQIGRYKKPVLVLHGDKDPLLPASWSLMAASAYSYPIFQIIQGGQHGFHGEALKQALTYILEYLKKYVF